VEQSGARISDWLMVPMISHVISLCVQWDCSYHQYAIILLSFLYALPLSFVNTSRIDCVGSANVSMTSLMAWNRYKLKHPGQHMTEPMMFWALFIIQKSWKVAYLQVHSIDGIQNWLIDWLIISSFTVKTFFTYMET
jgi:hypothetical protein